MPSNPTAGSTDETDRFVNDVHQDDAVEALGEMPADSVHCVMTSPPYFGLRDYGVDGQIGLEESLDEYIQSIVEVADELQRVLRDDGSWWLNLGDSFAGSRRGQWDDDGGRPKEAYSPDSGQLPDRRVSLRRKSKMLVPHRVAIALQDVGWIVRSDAVWSKLNPMPDPVQDRLNEQKEFLFHLTPAPNYWFDLDAIREEHAEASLERSGRHDHTQRDYPGAAPQTLDPDQFVHPNGKNPGDIFEVTVKPFPEAHFAVYPPELCEKPIKSSCPLKVCADCGAPYERDVEEVPVWKRDRSTIDRPQLQEALDRYDESGLTEQHLEAARAKGFSDAAAGKQQTGAGRNTDEVETLAEEAKEVLDGYFREITMTARKTGEWSQDCDCETDETEPGIVLDPFVGAGTTLLVAKEYGRRFIGIDLNPEFVAMAQKRVGVDVDQPELLLDDENQSTLAQTDGGERPAAEGTGGDRSDE
jgi:DNA modification methylase